MTGGTSSQRRNFFVRLKAVENYRTMPATIELFRGDITTLAVDAIVNAANPNLTPDGAAGSRQPGEVAIAPGFGLPAKYVIHAVGPSWLARGTEGLTLARMYRNAFALAKEHGVRSIAFPAISCGVDSFPIEPAASIAVREARAADVDRVIFSLVTDDAVAAYERALEGDAPEWITVIRGGIKKKAEIHRDGDWHVAAHVWIIAPDGRVLLQRRSTQKENWPGYWDVSAAGHVSAGETPVDAAIRETFEELGLRIAPDELQQLGSTRQQIVLRNGTYIDNEEHQIFAVNRDVDLRELKLQEGEVEDVMFASLDRLPEPLVPHEIEYQLLRGFVLSS